MLIVSASNLKYYNSPLYSIKKIENNLYRNNSCIISDTVSFTSNYKKDDAINLISQAKAGNIKPLGCGYHNVFLKLNDTTGIKIPKILNSDVAVSKYFYDGIDKEFLGLKIVQELNPEIAVKPIDLVAYNNQNNLVMELVSGKHPCEAKFNIENLKNLINKLYELDINGIAHCDLQNANIFITSDNKTKLIDFGSFDTLLDDGSYISSEYMPTDIFKNIMQNNRKSSKEEKFLATFFNNNTRVDLKNYSDNSFLKIKSNISNFEFRTIYDYIKHGATDNPKEYLKDYLKVKAECYHKKMADFLEHLQPPASDIKQRELYNNAIRIENLFADIFSNPSDNVLKTELGKIQLKWLINDYQGNKTKAHGYYISLLDLINDSLSSSSGNENLYFEQMKYTLLPYQDFLDTAEFKGEILADGDNIVKKVFNKIVNPVSQKSTNLNKKLLAISILSVSLVGLGVFTYKKYNSIIEYIKKHLIKS